MSNHNGDAAGPPVAATDIQTRLRQIRGAVQPKRHNARTIAALTTNPGCLRRRALDAPGVDKNKLAAIVGHPTLLGRLSRFAVARGNAFEAQVKADGCADVLRLAREHLGLPVSQVAYADLNAMEGSQDQEDRCDRSLKVLAAAAGAHSDAGTLFDHPLLRLLVGGTAVYLEPDLVIAFHIAGKFYVVEIKSFPIIDETATPRKVAAAATQSAVYVLAMRSALQEAGYDPMLVSHEVLLVCPKDFINHPTAAVLDVRKQLKTVERQLRTLDRMDDFLESIPDGLTFDLRAGTNGKPTRPVGELIEALESIPARYAPECLGTCEMAGFCRQEARGSTLELGRTVREDLGGIESIDTALALATGAMHPTSDKEQAAALLTLAHRMRTECLAGAL